MELCQKTHCNRFKSLEWFGVYNQEAHDTKIWPIALPGALPPTFSQEEREGNLKTFLDRYPRLAGMKWMVDIPDSSWFHVGGSFNQVFNAWPHRYFVIYKQRLVYRSEFFLDEFGESFIDFGDLISFLNRSVSKY